MTTDWQPGGEPPTVSPPAAPQSGYYTPPPQPGHGYNWGLAYPAPGYQAFYLVPRPPRPGVVNLAVVLTILGVLISGAQSAINIVTTYAHKNDLVTGLSDANGGQSQQLVNSAFQIGLGVSVVFWLLPAAGALATALLARRGSNAARIVLACLMGLFALNDLCSGVFGLVNARMATFATVRESGLSSVFDLVLTGLAVAIGVLVLVPSANRFFSAGPGRRFMTST